MCERNRETNIPRSDTLIEHQAVEVETLASDNVFGTLAQTLDFTWASRGRLQVVKRLAAMSTLRRFADS
jgi:hypothetical protein